MGRVLRQETKGIEILKLLVFNFQTSYRSKAHRMGLPKNRGLDVAKVACANLLYPATVEIAKLCLQYIVLCSIENPENSLFWDTDPIQELFDLCPGYRNVSKTV